MNSEIKNRYLIDIAFSSQFGRQMRFIAGPRQCGKTTIARQKLDNEQCLPFYYNWDQREIKDRYRGEGNFLKTDLLSVDNDKKKPWVCFDEIHKFHKWKNVLKGFFDEYERSTYFIITGSARLDLFRKAGDSLAGRYFLFTLHPFILSEFIGKSIESVQPVSDAKSTIEKMIRHKPYRQEELTAMLYFSGFPEPLLKKNKLFSKKWHTEYIERIVKEDLRDLSSIHGLEKVMDLIYLLPSKIGSPLSINSLREDLELNFMTVKNYIRYLLLTYVLFEISPYTKKNTRLVKKEKKVYFYDWVMVPHEGARFENFVAHELKARINIWNESSGDSFGLYFVRSQTGEETDFLITKNNTPFFLCEAKISGSTINLHHYRQSELLGNIPIVQIVKENNVLYTEGKIGYIVSASRFFG